MGPTFALWRVLAAVPEDVDLIDRSVGLKQLLQLLLRPGARDLAHEHLDGVRVGLVGMLQRPVHLPGGAVAVGGGQREKREDRPASATESSSAGVQQSSAGILGFGNRRGVRPSNQASNHQINQPAASTTHQPLKPMLAEGSGVRGQGS